MTRSFDGSCVTLVLSIAPLLAILTHSLIPPIPSYRAPRKELSVSIWEARAFFMLGAVLMGPFA